MEDQVSKEYGDETLDGLMRPSGSSSSLEVEDNYAPPVKPKKSLLFYLATAQAFVIIYHTEVLLGVVLAISVGIAFSSMHAHRHPKINPFKAAQIGHNYAAEITSKYDLTLGFIDHWCLHGDDNNCRCEDPLVPMSKRSSHKWSEQHTENSKVAQAALMKLLQNNDAWNNYEDYQQDLDDMWLEAGEDDWVYGEGARFWDDDMGYDPRDWLDDLIEDDMFADVEESDGGNKRKKTRKLKNRKLDSEQYDLDVVFIGDSITEQRQGTSMGKPVTNYDGVKEIFDKTFTKSKGGEFNGIAMGIAGDTSANLLWRLMNGEMPYGLTPRVWWVGIGTNDLSMKGCSEEVVLLGILRVVEEIQNSHPNDIIVINSILPINRNEDGLLEHVGKHHEDVALKKKEKNLKDNEMSTKRGHIDFWPSIVSINKELKKFASAHTNVKFFNADTIFVEERGGGKYLKLDLMQDPVHPNVSGYKKWNNMIKKKLHELIKDD
mmetsp:Transcript_10894/g.19053  ORF Transcript_10894/g.19053 Transcript_10894/m.19053 type:complete len:489 (+) Transcript_10894:147-1613(+)|eukprot:CAMPEP_0183730620 /NCGR_PEP_ID=MMETSP0737-20130205/33300_1 /TAXON_ID=385413 /ORGANISM="Thalassiosira miniscula, Strain CCMP1093" /LENGTH=488 /DNA_ID=CAMNT_0025963167 /DNA_START=90 /DNA_END=1556 /DNA_ORIENTATION=-